jgi:hypothetical protein
MYIHRSGYRQTCASVSGAFSRRASTSKIASSRSCSRPPPGTTVRGHTHTHKYSHTHTNTLAHTHTGRKLALPAVPEAGERLEALANEVVAKHKLPAANVDAVRDVLIALRMLKEEQDGNQAHILKRQRRSVFLLSHRCIEYF